MQRRPFKDPGTKPTRRPKATPTVAEVPAPQGNARYLVLDFEREYQDGGATRTYRYQVYLLPAGAMFEGFGGSRSGLLVGRTPSLVVRELHPTGQRDTEYDLAAKGVWQFLIAEGLTNFSTLRDNGAVRMADGCFNAAGTAS